MMTVRPTTAGGGRSSALPTDLLMARLDKRQMMHALEARVLEHDASIRRHDAKLRRQRAASLQELKRAGQALLSGCAGGRGVLVRQRALPLLPLSVTPEAPLSQWRCSMRT